MTFVFGGAYQGMDTYVQEQLGIHDIGTADENARDLDFSARAIGNLDAFVLGCVRRGESAVAYFDAHREDWQDLVLIGTDFSCGLVPMDAQVRLWREENGRLNNYLSTHADRVVRLFCGIAQVLK